MCNTQNQILENFGGEIENCLGTIFANIDDDEGASPIVQTSTYLDPGDTHVEHFLSLHQDHFTIFSMNADSLHAKHVHLQIFIDNLLTKSLHFSALCFQEAHISSTTKVTNVDLPGYELIPQPLVCSSKGGLAIYLHRNFVYLQRTIQKIKNMGRAVC